MSSFIFVCSVVWLAYNLFDYYGAATNYILTALWNSLTPGNELLDLAIIMSTLISGIVMFFALKGMADILDKGFATLKNEINKKDEIIRELKAKIDSLEAVSTSSFQKDNTKLWLKLPVDIEED